MTAELQWLGDDGPLVLLVASEARGWLGVYREAGDGDPDDEVEDWSGRRMILDDELDEEQPSTDYARVCAALDPPALVALVPFETGTALALETTGHQATFVRSDADVIVAKWIFAPDEAHAASALDSLPTDPSWKDTEVVFEVKETGVLLHPAADPFGAESEGLRFPLETGRYALATALHEPDEETSFELFRLRRV